MRAKNQHFASIYNDVERFPSIAHVAEELGVSEKTVQNTAAEMRQFADQGVEGIPELISRIGTGKGAAKPKSSEKQEEIVFEDRKLVDTKKLPAFKTKTRRFILTSAQDESTVHEGFLQCLESYANWLGSTEILVSGFTYNKSVYEDGQSKPTAKRMLPRYFAESIRQYLVSDQVQIGENVLFCGEMNTLPTAANPLSGFETYTRDKWGIFPHAKQRLVSVATAKKSPSKQLLTTGAVTKGNYVQKKAGIIGEFHHVIGAVIVELMPDGTFFARHISTSEEGDGSFQDLDVIVSPEGITEGNRIEALNPGDIHEEKLDPVVAKTTFGIDTETRKVVTKDNLMERLDPKFVFMHDLSDFAPRNHHNIKDPHFIFKTFSDGTDDVKSALAGCSDFLGAVRREGTRVIVIQSNHDNALLRWLKTVDYREDPQNAVFFLETQASYYQQLEMGIDDPPIFEEVLRDMSPDALMGVQFVNEDDSFVICDDIECGMHGHLGANGARGNPRAYTKMGMKSNTGHTHSPQIIDGAYVAGVSGKLDMGYNRGLSSWEHSHIVTYPDGKRAIISMRNGRWYAPR